MSEELSDLQARLLLSPKEWPFAIDNVDRFRDFLQKIGVRDGIWPMSVGKQNIQHLGNSFNAWNLSNDLRLEGKDKEFWVAAVKDKNEHPSHPNTVYNVQGYFWRLPGQTEHSSFSNSAKGLYARLIIYGLGQWANEHLETAIKSGHSRDPDPLNWPTPLTAFLLYAKWLPVSLPGDRRIEDFVLTIEAWHFREDNELPPSFAAFIPHDIRRSINDTDLTYQRLRDLGLKVWNEPKDALALVRYLGCLFVEGAISDESQVLSFKKAYKQAWIDTADKQLYNPFDVAEEDAVLVVTRGNKLSFIEIASADEADTAEPVYVQDTSDSFAAQILESLELPVLKLDDTHGPVVANLLHERLGVCRRTHIFK